MEPLFRKKEYAKIIHLFRKKNMIRYEVDEPLKPLGKPKTVDTSLYLQALAKEGRLEELYEAFRFLMDPKHPSSVLVNTMIDCLLSLGRYEDAVKIYKNAIDVKQTSLVTAKTVGIFLKYLVQQKRFDDAIHFFEKHCHAEVFTRFHIVPDIGAVHMLVRAYIFKGDLLGARRALEDECLTHKMTPTVNAVGELIQAHLRCHDLDAAYWVFIDFFTQEKESEISNPMIRLLESVVPSSRILNMLLQAYIEHNQMDTALGLFDRFCVPTKATETDPISGEEKIVQRLPPFKTTPAILETIVSGLISHNRAEEAQQVYEAFFRGRQPILRLKPTHEPLVNTMLRLYSTTGNSHTETFFKNHFEQSHDVEDTPDAGIKFPLGVASVSAMMEYWLKEQKPFAAANVFIEWSKHSDFASRHAQRRVQELLEQTIASLGQSRDKRTIRSLNTLSGWVSREEQQDNSSSSCDSSSSSPDESGSDSE